MNKKTPSGYDTLHLSNVDQRERETTPEMNSHKIDDDFVKSTTFPRTPKETPEIPIQTETFLLQNAKQIHKPSAQH